MKRCYSCGTTSNVYIKKVIVVNIDLIIQFSKPRVICKRCIERTRAELEITTEEVFTSD